MGGGHRQAAQPLSIDWGTVATGPAQFAKSGKNSRPAGLARSRRGEFISEVLFNRQVNIRFVLPAQRNATLSAGSIIRSTWLFYFAQPAHDRPLLKAIHAKPIRSVVELGVGQGQRTARIFEVLLWKPENLPLRYTGIDLFESRPKNAPGLSLKKAFGQIRAEGVKVQLVPGDPLQALQRSANGLPNTDLVLIAADQDRASLAEAYRFLPRMLHEQSQVWLEEPAAGGKLAWRQIPLAEIHQQAARRPARRAA